MSSNSRERVLSGIQATGKPTVGNYATLRHWPGMSEKYDCVYCVVDLHAVTVQRKPEELRRESLEIFSFLLSLGLDPKRDILFLQGHVPQHSELSWLLGCYTMFGELSRMHQFKEKSDSHKQNINAGLFTYPVLMAADILLYDAKLVPVGTDQKQHVELARDVCLRFNGIYGDVLTVPEPWIAEVGARVMSLAEPNKKMSKSDENPNASIFITDDKDAILKKCRRAVTDAEPCVRYDPENKPGVSNLMTLYSVATGMSFDSIEREFEGQGYGVFKPAVGEAIDAALAPIRGNMASLLSDKAQLDAYLRAGAERASDIASGVLNRVKNAMGFYTVI